MQFLKTATFLSTAFVAATSAFPFQELLPRELSELIEKRENSNSKRDIESRAVHHEIELMAHQDDWAGFRLAGCNSDGAQIPKTGLKDGELPYPDEGLKLTRVIIGIGTQNYTCSASDSSPQANGATAILYDAGCLAEYSPSLLHELPTALIQVPHKNIYTASVFAQRLFNTESNPDTPHKHESLIVGHHFFKDPKTPVFDFRSSSPDHDKIFFGALKTKVPAPEFASTGRSGHAFGAVDWLQLVPKEGDADAQTVGYKMAYRVITAGGKPPSSCNGFGDHIEVPYVSEYWFYN